LCARLTPGGRLIGLDVDPVEHPKTTARLRAAGWGEDVFTAIRSNFAGLPRGKPPARFRAFVSTSFDSIRGNQPVD
jgi:16S rRNA (cytosine1402-N4)-methyltransferase